jgi:ABC-type polysaccharide/polyol phosphate export permease
MYSELKFFYYSLLNYHLWFELAQSKIRARFNRTVLGPLWEILGSLVLLFLLAFLWSKLWKKDFLDFFSYLFIGFTLWRIILSSVTDANGLFSHTYNSLLKNVSLHPFILCIASSYKNIVTLLLNTPIIFFVLVINDEFYFSSLIYFFIFIILFFISNICVTFIFSILCLRFRDLEHTITVFFGILFFFTPIIWSVDQLGDKVFLIQPNILYHYVEFFRSGLRNGYVDPNSILIVFIFTILLLIFSIFLSKKFKKKINYWVD